MRRMVFDASCALRGNVSGPFSMSHASAYFGFSASRGSEAIHTMNGIKGSFASAELRTTVSSIAPALKLFTSSGTGVFTVSESDEYWRQATATARRTEASLSVASLFRRSKDAVVG